MFETIDTEAKAYVLGLLTSANVNSDTIVIPVSKAKGVFVHLMYVFPYHVIRDAKVCTIKGPILVEVIKSHLRQYPVFSDDALHWAFIRGIVDSELSCLTYNLNNLECTIVAPISYLQEIARFANIPSSIVADTLIFTGTNCIDFLGKIYPHDTEYKIETKYLKYIDFLMWRPCDIELPVCRIRRVHELAVIPCKNKESDAGYDLTIIKEEKKFLANVTLYDTGIQIQTSHGIYAEVVPRSSLSKSGYMLANSIGIIDRGYTGNIFIALIKVDPDAPDIKLPFKCCQLIFRHQVHVNLKEIDEKLQETARGSGGFGSTSEPSTA